MDADWLLKWLLPLVHGISLQPASAYLVGRRHRDAESDGPDTALQQHGKR